MKTVQIFAFFMLWALFGYAQKVYVTNASPSNKIQVINSQTNTITNTITINGYDSDRIAVSPNGKKIYAVSLMPSEKINVINTEKDSIEAVIVSAPPLKLMVSPDGSKLFVLLPSSLNIINTNTFVLETSIPQNSAIDFTITSDGKKAYIAQYGTPHQIKVLNLINYSIETSIPIPSNDDYATPMKIAISPNGLFVYVLNERDYHLKYTMFVFYTVTNTISKTFYLNTSARQISITPDGKKAYVLKGSAISVMDLTGQVIIKEIPLIYTDKDISFSYDGKKAYVVDYVNKSIKVIDVETDSVIAEIPCENPNYVIAGYIYNNSALATSCTNPSNLTTTNITNSSALLKWSSVAGAVSYEVSYKPTSTSTWSTANTSDTTLIISGLSSGAAYEYKIRTLCYSNYSSTQTFTTLLQCNPPTGLNSSNLDNTSATVSWSGANGGLSYDIAYKITGQTTWTTVNTSNASITLSGLYPGTNYTYKVRSKCSVDTSFVSAYTTESTFATTGTFTCDVPSNVNASNISNNSMLIAWNAVYTAQSYDVYYRVVGITNFQQLNTTQTSITLSNLYAGMNYEYRVRSKCQGNNTSTSAFSPFKSAYTTGSPTCAIATNLTNLNVTDSTATVSWNTVSGATQYQLLYALYGVNTWTTITVNGTSHTITGLLSGMLYYWRVRAVCASDLVSEYSTIPSFTTTGASACADATNLQSSNITTNSAYLTWNSANGANSYSVLYGISGSNTWTTINTNNTFLNLTGLSPNTTYAWRVRSQCGSNIISPALTIPSFTTSQNGARPNNNNNTITQNIKPESDEIKVFPNPSSSEVNFEFNLDKTNATEKIKIKIYNNIGNQIDEIFRGSPKENGKINITYSANKLAKGVYFYEVEMQNQKTFKGKFLIQ